MPRVRTPSPSLFCLVSQPPSRGFVRLFFVGAPFLFSLVVQRELFFLRVFAVGSELKKTGVQIFQLSTVVRLQKCWPCRACRATVLFRHHTSLKARSQWPSRAICVVILIPAASPGPGQHVLRIRRTCCPGFPGHQTRESNAQDRELSFQNESSRSCIEAAGSLRLAAQFSLHLGSEMKKKLRCEAQ